MALRGQPRVGCKINFNIRHRIRTPSTAIIRDSVDRQALRSSTLRGRGDNNLPSKGERYWSNYQIVLMDMILYSSALWNASCIYPISTIRHHLDRALSVIPTIKVLQTMTRINGHAADHDYPVRCFHSWFREPEQPTGTRRHLERRMFHLILLPPDWIWDDDGSGIV